MPERTTSPTTASSGTASGAPSDTTTESAEPRQWFGDSELERRARAVKLAVEMCEDVEEVVDIEDLLTVARFLLGEDLP